jgi:hypothetical protein
MLAVAVMVAGVLAVYCPPALLSGESVLYGMDFWALHLRRLEFAREHLAASPWTLPAWYPRELLGTPFRANLQSFPWIPTRLVLLPLDPSLNYAVGVNLAAALAALFTYLYGRAIGLGRAGAALGGWTFACAGFFAARVTVGHLPLLEAYPALPLLLWLAERTRREERRAGPLAALALGTASVVVAGHPQLPAYAVAGAGLSLAWTGGRGALRRGACAMALGAGSALFAWWPMLDLLRRSTRVLPLERALNDVAFPYARLAALFLPWRDGWPQAVERTPPRPFTGFPGTAHFWDTVAYVGILPWLAAAALLIALLLRRRRPGPHAAFLLTLGTAGLVLALPLAHGAGSLVPGTILRSSARLLYLTTFALSLAAGAGLDAVVRSMSGRPWLGAAVAGPLVLLHALDLGTHDAPFIRTRPRAPSEMPAAERLIAESLGSGRVAIDYNLALALNRRFDDVGFFDSVLLARPYRALLELAGAPPGLNVQTLSGSELPARALASVGVRWVLTGRERPDLPLALSEGHHLYAVPEPASRAAFFAPGEVRFLDEGEMHARLAEPGHRLTGELMLPPGARATGEAAATSAPGTPVAVEYRRPSSDRVVLGVDAPGPGFVRLLESWDPGWTASLDGTPVPVLRADTFAMAVAVGPGRHRIEVTYATPGARTGAALSLLSLAALAWLLWRDAARRRSPGS